MIERIKRVPLREVWPHEANDFTTWMEGNIDILNEILDLNLDNAEREKEAGTFSVDLVAEDEQGNPVPAGTYTWKLLMTQGLRAEYLLTLGTNPMAPWDTWPGNHHGAMSVAVDEGGMYVATTSGEGTRPPVSP